MPPQRRDLPRTRHAGFTTQTTDAFAVKRPRLFAKGTGSRRPASSARCRRSLLAAATRPAATRDPRRPRDGHRRVTPSRATRPRDLSGGRALGARQEDLRVTADAAARFSAEVARALLRRSHRWASHRAPPRMPLHSRPRPLLRRRPALASPQKPPARFSASPQEASARFSASPQEAPARFSASPQEAPACFSASPLLRKSRVGLRGEASRRKCARSRGSGLSDSSQKRSGRADGPPPAPRRTTEPTATSQRGPRGDRSLAWATPKLARP